MNEDSEIVVRCAVGVTDVFKEEVGLPQDFLLVCRGDGQIER